MGKAERCWKCGKLPITAVELYSTDIPMARDPACEACDIGHVFNREIRMHERNKIRTHITFLEEKIKSLEEKEASITD